MLSRIQRHQLAILHSVLDLLYKKKFRWVQLNDLYKVLNMDFCLVNYLEERKMFVCLWKKDQKLKLTRVLFNWKFFIANAEYAMLVHKKIIKFLII